MEKNKLLVYDIETACPGKPDPKVDEFRTIDFYEVEIDKHTFYTLHDKDKIQAMFRKHKVICGYNNKMYDDPILKRFGINLNYHINIDMYEVVKKRGIYLGIKNISLSLDSISKFFKLPIEKLPFNYAILKKTDWTPEELEYIKEYNNRDVELTFAVFERFRVFFEPFKEFLDKKDCNNYSWLKSAISVYTYKVFCNLCGLEEKYNDKAIPVTFEGGYVAKPVVKKESGNIFCLDVASLYPHIYICCNLTTHAKRREPFWKGDNFFDVKGKYAITAPGRINLGLKKIYDLRAKYKKDKDPRQYALKFVINTFYGITGNPVFESVYDFNSARDCTAIGRKCIQYARDVFEHAGYKFLYTDTDSIYIKDPYKDEQQMLQVKDVLMTELKKHMPFPVESFDMDIDYEIKHIWFFDGKKKTYMFVTNDGKLVIKGLSIIKNDGSGIGLQIFNKHMRESLIQGLDTFKYSTIYKEVVDLVSNDVRCTERKFKVYDKEVYKNKSQIQYQISNKYGAGIHRLIPNNRFGIGKGIKYCTYDEFVKHKLTFDNIVLTKMWEELKPFLNYVPKKKKMLNINPGQMLLASWGGV